MSSGGRRKSGTPLNGQPRFKQLSGIYRSVEGALGQALRLSRRSAGAAAVVWQKHWDPLESKHPYIRANGIEHIALKGFECDGGSIPRAAWWLIGHPLDGEFVRSCVIHDWLCKLAREQNRDVEVSPGVWERPTRGHADSVFLEALRCESLPEWKARAMYSAVRVGAVWKR